MIVLTRLLELFEVGCYGIVAACHVTHCNTNPDVTVLEWVVAAAYVTLALVRAGQFAAEWVRGGRQR
jgi:hypothetical protein